MKTFSRLPVLLSGLTLLGSLASAATPLLTSLDGMTVYTFDQDAPGAGTSACSGPCAAMWPPVVPDVMAAGPDIGSIVRADGAKQATYRGRPIYFYTPDRRPGDATGDQQGKVWHVVEAGSALAPRPPKPPAARAAAGSYDASAY